MHSGDNAMTTRDSSAAKRQRIAPETKAQRALDVAQNRLTRAQAKQAKLCEQIGELDNELIALQRTVEHAKSHPALRAQ